MKKISFVLLIVIAILTTGNAFGQNLDASVYTKEMVYTISPSTFSATFTLDKPLHFPAYPNKTVKYARSYIEISPVSMPLPVTGTFTCSLSVNGRASNGTNVTCFDNTTNPNTQIYPVNITSTNPSAVIYNDFTLQYTGAAPTLYSFVVSSPSVSNTFAVGTNFQVKVKLEIAYNLDVNENNNVKTPLNVTSLKPTFNAYTPRVGKFSWGTRGIYYPAYQLQVLRLHNKNPLYVEPACSTTIDWSKAVTVNIENDLTSTLNSAGFVSYDYTIAEGTGFYVWRVRPVGNSNTGGFANDKNFGTNWSVNIAEGTWVDLTNISSTGDGYFYFTDQDADKNWIYSRIFTEKTNIKESITYADYLKHTKQTQTYLPSKRATILMQYVMDYMGRPAISTMPVPQENIIGLRSYQTNFMQNSVGNLFRNIDFDSDAALAGSPSDITVNPVNGFQYYNNNLLKSIPNSGGFPYSRTIFENSSNSRVIEQSGVGAYHRIGTDHTTQTLYSTASDQELIRILGDEAPRGNKVLKTTTLDPNRTASVSYTDMNGKVIATCLSFNEGDIANGTVNPDDAINPVNIAEEMNNNIKVADGLISTKRISFTENDSPLGITYEFPCQDPIAMCGTLGTNGCRYKLIVVIHDVANPTNRLEATQNLDMATLSCVDDKFTTTLTAFDFKYVEQVGQPSPASPLTLDRGDYIIEKRLIFDRSNNAAVADIALQSIKSRVEGFAKTIVDGLKNIKTQSQYNTFLSNYQCHKVVPTGCAGNPVTCSFVMTPGSVSANTCFSGFNEGNGEIQISILPIDPLIPQVRMLKLESQCCDFNVPIEFIPPLECPTTATPSPSDYQVFYDYTVKFLQQKGLEHNGNSNFFLSQGANLWGNYVNQANASTDLKYMIYHMLQDSYQENPASLPETHYKSCEDLADCWTSALNAVTEAQMMPIEDNSTASDDMDFDDMFNDMPGGGILKIFMGKKKKAKIKAQIDAQLAGLSSMNFSGPDLMEVFFDCAGRKYKDVITEFQSPAVDVFGSSACATTLAGAELTDYNTPSDHSRFWRIYQFKYVRYYIDNLGFKRQYNCEASSCFCPSVQNAPCTTSLPVCYDDDNVEYSKCNPLKTHHDWTFAERHTFSKCIQNRSSSNLPTILSNDSDELDNYNCADLVAETNPEFIRWIDLKAELDKLEAGCESDCEEHRSHFTKKVKELFTSHCYNIVATTCNLGPNDVPQEDIALIVDQMILQCKSMCDINYLAGENITCAQCEIGGYPRTYVKVIMGSAREKLLVHLAKLGNVELDIESRCTEDYGQVSCNLGSIPPTTGGSGFTPACGKDYNIMNNTIADFCILQPFNSNLNPCPLDQLDANNVTQPVKIRVKVE